MGGPRVAEWIKFDSRTKVGDAGYAMPRVTRRWYIFGVMMLDSMAMCHFLDVSQRDIAKRGVSGIATLNKSY